MVKQVIARTHDGWDKLPESWPNYLRKIFSARGIATEQDMQFKLNELPKPELLLGMEHGVKLLEHAIEAQLSILVVGDFDADGATSSALAVKGLRAMGAKQVDYLVPNRFVHGYGLTPELLDDIAKTELPDLIITVDNGIASHSGVEAAHQLGIKVLITDHHLPGEQLPDAEAIINPNQVNDAFPSKHLAGVGVIFYVLMALRQRLRKNNWFVLSNIEEPKLIEFTDLVALGTVADVVKLDKLNRTLVNLGMGRIRNRLASPGIQALISVSGKDETQLSTTDIAFSIAPRLNAAGRMEDMRIGIETLLMTDSVQAREAAQLLDQINIERRYVEKEMQSQAQNLLANLSQEADLPIGYCLFDETWHQGVVGLLASRLKEKHHRPVIVFAPGEEGELKGSARSIPGVHIRDVLADIANTYPKLLERFGGHAMAAGLTIKSTDLADFKSKFLSTLQSVIAPELLHEVTYTDGELLPNEITLETAALLSHCAPWGQAFPEPLFEGNFEVDQVRHIGKENEHVRFILKASSYQQVVAIAFNYSLPEWLMVGNKARFLYRLSVNEYKDVRSVQMIISDIVKAS